MRSKDQGFSGRTLTTRAGWCGRQVADEASFQSVLCRCGAQRPSEGLASVDDGSQGVARMPRTPRSSPVLGPQDRDRVQGLNFPLVIHSTCSHLTIHPLMRYLSQSSPLLFPSCFATTQRPTHLSLSSDLTLLYLTVQVQGHHITKKDASEIFETSKKRGSKASHDLTFDEFFTAIRRVEALLAKVRRFHHTPAPLAVSFICGRGRTEPISSKV